MQISKQLADSISKEIATKLKVKVDKAEAEYLKLATSFYKKQVPAAVLRMQKQHPDYFQTGTSLCLNGHGFHHEVVKMSESLVKNSGNYYSILHLTPAIARELIVAKNNWENLQEQYKQLRAETTTALLNLRTFKNIQEQLPEAVKYLPKSKTTAIIPNLGKLRVKIQEVA